MHADAKVAVHLGGLLLVFDVDGDADVAGALEVDDGAHGDGEVVEAVGALVELGALEESVADGFFGEEVGEDGGVSRGGVGGGDLLLLVGVVLLAAAGC